MLGTTQKSDAPAAEETQVDQSVIDTVNERYGEQFNEIEETVKSLTDEIEELSGDSAKKDEVEKRTKQLEDLDETVKSLKADRDREIVNAQVQSLGATAKSLSEAIQAAREPHSDFSLGTFPSAEEQDAAYGAGSEYSFFKDASKALTLGENSQEWDRWQEAVTEKAMTQASGSTGGYLVPPQVSSELIRIREQSNILRPLLSKIQVNADVLRIAAQTSGLLAGWVAELAEKPESELTFGEISVNVFWKAGMSVVSNQLLRNSNPSIDSLIYNELGRRLAALEEIAFISGSGTGQPLGILGTPGVQFVGDGFSGGSSAFTSTAIDDLLDEIIDGITAIYTEYFGAPNGILMHPRTWGRIVKARKDDAIADYAFPVGPGSRADGARTATDPLPGYGSGPNPTGSLFGLPVYTTRNMPTKAGTADNESRVIVGNFQEGLILDHAAVTLDSSEHVYFRTNQTIFRAEDAVGFTAARYPKAFYVIGGAGLADG